MNTSISVIDRAFLQYDPKDNCLIISKPGHQINGTYYPAESVTLMGVNIASELLAFAREIKQKELTNDSNVQAEPPKPGRIIDKFPQAVQGSVPWGNSSNLGNLLGDIQNAGTSSRGNLPEDL